MPDHKPTLTDKLYKALKSAILDHQIWPGSRLVIADLAQQYGVSPTPVRECLGKLASEGLVAFQPHRGAVVCQPSIEQFEAAHEVRHALESLAGKLACENLTPSEIEELERVHRQMLAAYDAEDFSAYVAADDRFHQLILQASRNPMLITMLQSIFDQLHRYRMATRSGFPAAGPAGMAEHRLILDAFREGDPSLAYERSADHVTQVWSRTNASVREFFDSINPLAAQLTTVKT